MKKHNQKGLGHLVIVITILVVAAIGASGWYVYRNNSKTKSDVSVQATEDWTSYTDPAGHFSLKHPLAWHGAENPEDCGEGNLYLVSDKNSTILCGKDGVPEISVIWYQSSADLKLGSLEAAAYDSITSKKVQISGVEATQYHGVTNDAYANTPNYLPAGVEVTRYYLKKGNSAYIIEYNQTSDDKKTLDDFIKMATTTFKATE